ncbi:MAG: hypothetical protein GC160_26565 [Acidobacteria bacterium]|nr:hypothetical protein [Acidobacteriota bacterium]
MNFEGAAPVVDETVKDLAAAYLWMWQALEVFDPDRDAWSEPTDFGNPRQRVARAEEGVKRVVERSRLTPPEWTEDVRKYREAAEALEAGAPFDEAMRRHSARLLTVGNDLAGKVVRWARPAASPGS